MSTAVLQSIKSPDDLKRLPMERLLELAEELRETILSVVMCNGGHLATNLGSVELTIALHLAFDSPRDRIIWDVGNQCYAHKMLTGRRDLFPTIRQPAGLSGFSKRGESPHDHFTTGHAGTALSSALGLARAREQLGEDYWVVVVVGDGALSAGLSFEALNNLHVVRRRFLVILNDNAYSISPSSGALEQRLRESRRKLLDSGLFGALGIRYLGPIDGHDMDLVVSVLGEIKRQEGPALLHVLTQKGKGYPPAEENPAKFHGVSPGSASNDKKPKPITYSAVFADEFRRLCREDQRIVAVSAAMLDGTGLSAVQQEFPDRVFDVGIAEQHAVTFGGGLAAGGCRPVVAIYSTFLQRGYDSLIHDVCLQGLPVTFVVDRAGIAGEDGPTHHGVFDLAYLRPVPGMILMAPKDAPELRRMLRLAIEQPQPTAIRIPRGAALHGEVTEPAPPFDIGQAEVLTDGDDVALLALGTMVSSAEQVADILRREGVSVRVVNARFVKPLDAGLILQSARRVRQVITLEEHVAHGGFGSAVLELLAQHGVRTPVCVLGLPDEFIDHGSRAALLDRCGLSVEKITDRVRQLLKADRPAAHRQARLKSRSSDSTGHGWEIAGDGLPTAEQVQQEISTLFDRRLSDVLQRWGEAYAQVGRRTPYLWQWVRRGVEVTTLPCVPPQWWDHVCDTKVLGVMLDVMLDDVADHLGNDQFLNCLLDSLLRLDQAENVAAFDPELQPYAAFTLKLWQEIQSRAEQYPCFDAYKDLLRYDYLQLFNMMRYALLLKRDPALLNLTEHDLYLPHNMHMMVSATLDLMCSPQFDRRELGPLREIVWHAQYMGRIGNLITTWQREIGEGDYTSGVFARALAAGDLTVEQLLLGDRQQIEPAIQNGRHEDFFLRRWQKHRQWLLHRKTALRSVDVGQLVQGLERLIRLHLGSRGNK